MNSVRNDWRPMMRTAPDRPMTNTATASTHRWVAKPATAMHAASTMSEPTRARRSPTRWVSAPAGSAPSRPPMPSRATTNAAWAVVAPRSCAVSASRGMTAPNPMNDRVVGR